MKKKLILTATVIGALFYSCKKDSPNTTNTNNNNNTSTTTVMAKDSSTQSGSPNSTEVREFFYNSSKVLVKVKFKYGTSTTYTNYDTIIYNGSGQISTVNSYSPSGLSTYSLSSTTTYNYTSGNLTSVVGPRDTLTLVYTGGKITTIYQAQQGNSSIDTITSITYTGSNATSLVYDGTAATAVIDITASNPYYGGYFAFSSSDFTNLLNQNNMTSAYATANSSMVLTTRTYTYSTSNRVITKVETDNSGTPKTTTTYITYESL